MKKNILKKLLLSAALIVPVAAITPVLITSCSQETPVQKVDKENTLDSILKDYIKPLLSKGKIYYYMLAEELQVGRIGTENQLVKKIKSSLGTYNASPPAARDFDVIAKEICNNLIDNSVGNIFNKSKGKDTKVGETVNTTTPVTYIGKIPSNNFLAFQLLIKGSLFSNLYSDETTTEDVFKIGNLFFGDGFLFEKEADKLELTVSVTIENKQLTTTGSTTVNVPMASIKLTFTPKEKWTGFNNTNPFVLNMKILQNLTQQPKV